MNIDDYLKGIKYNRSYDEVRELFAYDDSMIRDCSPSRSESSRLERLETLVNTLCENMRDIRAMSNIDVVTAIAQQKYEETLRARYTDLLSDRELTGMSDEEFIREFEILCFGETISKN